MNLQTRILIGLIAGIAIGALSKIPGPVPLQRGLLAIEPLGTAFIRLITMVVIPLVVASLFVGVAALGDVRKIGRIGGQALAWFLGTTVIAATIGLTIAMMARIGKDARYALAGQLEGHAGFNIDMIDLPSFGETLIDMVPQNIVGSAARGELLPLIVAVCLFAAATTTISDERKRTLLGFFEAVNEVSMVVVRWLMVLAPAAVFVLIASTVAKSGVDLLRSLFGYAMVVLLAMIVHVSVVLFPALVFGARIRVMTFLRAVSDALMLAFSTASSNVTLPVSMSAARNRLGLPADVVSFVLPAGATLNKNGAAVYKAVTAVFVAHLYGLDLSGAQLLTIVLTSTIAAFSGAGVPGDSLVTTLIVLNAIGLGPQAAAGIALVTGIDRPLDMVRTTVNTMGNLIGTAWIGRSARSEQA